MSDLLLIRHGATDLAGTFCGHADPPLNERGRQQVAALIEELKGDVIEAVFTSDLQRARETAAALATARAVPLHILRGLREVHFGEWEGLRWSEVEARDGQYADRWLAEHPNLTAPGGEAIREFEARVLATFETLLRTEQRSIAIVAHAGVMRVFMHRLGEYTEDERFARTKEYCSVVRLPRAHASDAIAGALEAVTQGVPQ